MPGRGRPARLSFDGDLVGLLDAQVLEVSRNLYIHGVGGLIAP